MDEQRVWARIGHQMGVHARWLLTQPTEFLVWSTVEDGMDYVQWHGESDLEFYAEAASGFYDGETQSPAVIAAMRALGWDPPGLGWGADAVQNWSKHWPAPVDLYQVVLLTVRTLRDVFGAGTDYLVEATRPPR